MTKSEGLRAVSEWEAEKELLNRGYTKAPCADCKGVGHIPSKRLTPTEEDLPFSSVGSHHWGRVCDHCEGHGWRWLAPLVRPISP